MRRITENIYRVNTLDSGSSFFVEAASDEDMIRYYVNYLYPAQVTVARFSPHIDLKPKLAIYTNPLYKKLIKEKKAKEKAEEKRRNTPPTKTALKVAEILKERLNGAGFKKMYEIITVEDVAITIDEIEFSVRSSKNLNNDHMCWDVAEPMSDFLTNALGYQTSVGYGEKGWFGGTVNTKAKV